MAKQNVLRTLFTLVFSLVFGSDNHSTGYMPAIDYGHNIAPAFREQAAFGAKRHTVRSARIPVLEKGHFFQFLVEEEAHVHVFCFDRLRRRRRFCRLICALTRLSLLVIHLNILLYHVDHLLHHQLHYLLKDILIG